MIKLLLSTITVFLFSFLTANGQMTGTPGIVATNPAVTINQAAFQADPTNQAPIIFVVQFDQPVTGFMSAGVTLSGTAGATTKVVTGGPTLYNVAVSGMTSCGTIIANIPAAVCTNVLLEPNLASTSTDNTVTYLIGNPNVTINQSVSQPDPTSVSPINFTVVFDQVVTGFATGDVTLSGTAGATTGIVTGSGTTYNVAVSGITAIGIVIATIAAGVSQNACTQPNNASTSTDNTVTVNCVPPVVNVTPATSCGGVANLGCNGPLTASGSADSYVWSPLAGLYTNCTLTAPYTGTNLSTVYAGPTVTTTYTVTGTFTASGCYSSATALVNYTPPAPVITPASVNMCIGDAPIKLKVVAGAPASPAVWSPMTGLYANAPATVPYIAGTAVDSVWVRPLPAGVYTYQVTTTAVPPGSSVCTSPPRSVVVTVGSPVNIVTQPVNKTVCANSSATFTVGVAGIGPFSYQWATSSYATGPFTNITNTAPFSGINTATLTINPATLVMSGSYFKVFIYGGGSCPSAASSAALLTVYASPTVAITANPLTISAGQTTTIFSTVTPNPAATYTWYYNGSVLPGATADTLLVNYGFAGDYQVKVTDVNGCGVGVSNIISIANAFAINLVPSPNPSTGKFQVTSYNETSNAVQRTITVFNNRGDKILAKSFTQTLPYQKVDVDVRANGKGIYWVALSDATGKRLTMNRVVVQ